jgi:hypothetical protein
MPSIKPNYYLSLHEERFSVIVFKGCVFVTLNTGVVDGNT